MVSKGWLGKLCSPNPVPGLSAFSCFPAFMTHDIYLGGGGDFVNILTLTP